MAVQKEPSVSVPEISEDFNNMENALESRSKTKRRQRKFLHTGTGETTGF